MSKTIKPAKDVMFKHVEGLPSIKKDGVFNFALDGENLLVQEIKIGFIKNKVLQAYKTGYWNGVRKRGHSEG